MTAPTDDLDARPTARSDDVTSSTLGLTTFAGLAHGTRFTLATGGGLLDPPHAPAATATPERLDAFEIVETLGEGGMGVVYLAEQHGPVRRRVALKVLKGQLAHGGARQRFAAERQAMARLAHPFIAQIFASGTSDDGYPYFVMEHVVGEPITAYCDHRRLTVDRRLDLARDVCRGVQHAHQKGVLHRDLKPSNILVTEVDGQPVPKIIDFGIAKGLDEPLDAAGRPTEAGLLGTPGYFSPEMVAGEGDVDTRADVYALGILIYELLIGRRPFDDETVSIYETLRRIVVEDAEPPSRRWQRLDAETRDALAAARGTQATTLGRRLRGDLDAIVAKAIERRPEARYATAEALGGDLVRHRRHEPIEAVHAGAGYRLRKLVRRHRGPAMATAALVLALAVGFVARSLEAHRANREAEAARQVTSFLVEMFESPDPRGRAEADLSARDLLDRGAERLRVGLHDQPLVRAQLLSTIGTVYQNLGLYDDAAALAEEALVLRTAHLDDDHSDIAASRSSLAVAHIHHGRYAEAEALLRQTIAHHEQAPDADPAAYGSAVYQLGRAMGNQERHGDAVAAFERALAIFEALPNDDLRRSTPLLGLSHGMRMLGRYDDAVRYGRQLVALRERALGDDHVLVADALERTASAYHEQGRYDDAAPLLQRALPILESAYGTDHPEILRTLSALGHLQFSDRRPEAARRTFDHAEAIFAAHPNANPHVHYAVIKGQLALAYGLGDWARCERYALEEKQLAEDLFGTHSVAMSDCLNALGVCVEKQGRLAEARDLYDRSRRLGVELLGPLHPGTQASLINRASILRADGAYAQAERELLQVHRIWLEVYGPDHIEIANVCQALGDHFGHRERWARAEPYHRCAWRIRGQRLDADSWQTRESRVALGTTLRQLGRTDEALRIEDGNAGGGAEPPTPAS